MSDYSRWTLEKILRKLVLILLFPVFAVFAPVQWVLHKLFIFYYWLAY